MEIDKSSARVRTMFGQIARRYDLLNHLLSLGIDMRWRRRAVRLAPPRGDAPVLDICTGTGDLALAYWRATRGSAVKIVGADFCRPMLDRAQEKCRRAGADDRIALVEADSLHLPFADEAFQIVAVAFGLRNVADTDRGLEEMARVCRPGGRVVVLEFSMPTGPVGWLYRGYFRYLLPWVGQTLAKNQQSAYNYLPESVGRFPPPAALAQRMAAAGLARVRLHRFTFGIATLYVGEK